MCATSCVARYRTTFSFDPSNGSRIDRMYDVKRVLGVSGSVWVSSVSLSVARAASAVVESQQPRFLMVWFC